MLKVSNRTPRGLLKVAQRENMQRFFCNRIDNLERVSQIILSCLLPPLSIICIWNAFAFIKRYFTFLDLLTLIFYCTLTAANVRDFKGTIARE